METGNNITRRYRLIADSLNDPSRNPLHLSVQLQADGLIWALLDKSESRYTGLGAYSFPGERTPHKLEKQFHAIAEMDEFLHWPSESRSVAWSDERSTLLPKAFNTASEEQKRELYAFNHPLLPGDQLNEEIIPGTEIANLWSWPENIGKWVLKTWDNPQHFHSSTCLISALAGDTRNTVLYVHVMSSSFDLVYFRNGKMEFFNSFPLQTTEDFLYYILFAIEQLGEHPHRLAVRLIGETEKNSALYKLMERYIRDMRFVPRPYRFKYDNALNELPVSFYFNLFNQHPCASSAENTGGKK